MFYRITIAVLWVYMKLIFRVQINGKENLPKQGALIVCANHFSNYDPIVLAISVKRSLRFLAKKELYANSFFSKVMKWLRTIPVDRGSADLKSYKAVMNALKKEEAVGIFIQGTRNAAQDAGKGGAALFALRSGATVVPVGISASYKPFSKIAVHIGEPLDLQTYSNQKIKTEAVSQVTAQIMERINELIEEV